MAGYAFLSHDFIPYILNSVAYFFQLNTVMTYSKYDSHMNFMVNQELVSILFFITIGYSFYKLYARGKHAPINKYSIPNQGWRWKGYFLFLNCAKNVVEEKIKLLDFWN